MNKLQESFEKAISDLYTIDWSETDGSEVKYVMDTCFDDIPNNRLEIKEMIDNCSSFNKYQKMLTTKVLEEY